MDINNLIDRGGLLYAPNKEKPFSGSVFDLYDNGQKKLNGRYRNGIKNGKWKWWNEDGGLDSTGSYKKGLMHGKWTSWYKNGIKSTEQTWKNGVEEGLFTRWYENGLQASEKTYKGGYLISQSINGNRWSFFSSDGKLIDEKCWDEDGNECECSEWDWGCDSNSKKSSSANKTVDLCDCLTNASYYNNNENDCDKAINTELGHNWKTTNYSQEPLKSAKFDALAGSCN